MLLGNLSEHVTRMTSTADTYMNAREMITGSKSLRESMPSPGECTKEQLSHYKFSTTLPSIIYRAWDEAQTDIKFRRNDSLQSFVNAFPLCFQWDEFALRTDGQIGWYCPCAAFMGGKERTQPRALTPGWLLHFKEVSAHVDLLGDLESKTLYKSLNHLGMHCMKLKDECVIHEFILDHLLKSYGDVIDEKVSKKQIKKAYEQKRKNPKSESNQKIPNYVRAPITPESSKHSRKR